jgi:amino acid transporter
MDTGVMTRAPTRSTDASEPRTNSGAGRVLVAVYAIFALAATARASVQLLTKFDEARLAYLLSAVAALIYIVATITLARGTRASRRVALVAIIIELVGVVSIGTLSVVYPAAFPRATVWSVYGIGYGFVPLVLPILGLAWLWRTRAH